MTIKELAVTEDQVKTLLELQTIQKKMYDPVVAEGKITVSDDEANQTTFTYVSISTSGDDITDEEKKTKKEQAQEILDKMKEVILQQKRAKTRMKIPAARHIRMRF